MKEKIFLSPEREQLKNKIYEIAHEMHPLEFDLATSKLRKNLQNITTGIVYNKAVDKDAITALLPIISEIEAEFSKRPHISHRSFYDGEVGGND
jgi:hypothetical protein